MPMTTKRGSESPGPQAGLPKAPRSLRVLIADDERDTVLTLMMLLRECSPNAIIALLEPLRTAQAP